jgi:hypothetical protein
MFCACIHPVQLLHKILLRFCSKLMFAQVQYMQACNVCYKRLQMAQGFDSCEIRAQQKDVPPVWYRRQASYRVYRSVS